MTSGQRRAAQDSDAPTRQSLLDATRRLIASEPADTVTSRAIAASAGANLGAITYYFGSKRRLVAESLVTTARALLEPAIAVLRSDLGAVDKLTQTITLLHRILRTERELVLAYVQALAAAPSDASIASQLQVLHRDIAAMLTEQIKVQQDDGQLPEWLAPAAMAQLIIAAVHGILVAAAVDPEHTDVTAVSSQLALLLIATRTGPAQD